MIITKPTVLTTTVWQRSGKGNEPVVMIVLQNRDITVECTNIGCAITAIYTPDRHQVKKNIVAGFTNWELYTINKDYLGCVVGRYANRISHGTFNLNGKTYQLTVNDRPNHLHGGWNGFSRKVWKLTGTVENENECGVEFAYASPDGEEGYPGNVQVTVKYILNNDNQLHIVYRATTDKSTPVNLTNHSYFNLTGFEKRDILDHYLQIVADEYTEKSAGNTPTGALASVYNTALNFTNPRLIGSHINCFPGDMGYDHNFILSHRATKKIIKAAVLSEGTTGRMLTVYTNKPAIQLYTANHWDGAIIGKQGVAYQKHGGVALETQCWPDSVNHRNFPNTILHPGEEYTATTLFEFGLMV
ncbi:galactose mutarotase [Niastella vici]|uniref:Aldose 1-epimerase n=1 Tax=Niastella vici TaxID=1703345 RepID=A0A1V9G0G4_9BACT|nr:aldose epimerase family protein [Niastella vici]OQP63976.1 galactose mutarotase [Niastella vici]